MSTWWPARLRLALIAVVVAAMTGAAVAALGGSGRHLVGAALYVVATVGALYAPAAITAQLITGQALAGSVLVVQGGSAMPVLLPVVAGVIVTTEVLGVIKRLDSPVERDPRDDLRRTGLAAIVGAAVFGAVVLVGRMPGPTGLFAVGLAAAACLGVAVWLVRGAGRQGMGEEGGGLRI